jgi:uncharacterized protein (TIGR03000 family)
MEKVMAKVILRGALCAALALVVCGGALRADGTGRMAGPDVKTTPTEKGRESKIRVLLPTADAKLYFDDTLTRANGAERIFRSPALEEGKRYTYRVVAVWLENGREVQHETKVVFHAGEDLAIDFRR